MLTKTRSDFWKCRASIQIEEKCYEQCGRINPSGHSCKCGNFSSTTDSPATHVEVLIAWLSADDERRKEIEIASRPTKAGRYVAYSMIHPFQKGTIAKEPARTFFIEGEEGLFYEMNNATCRMDENLYGWLWEPLSE